MRKKPISRRDGCLIRLKQRRDAMLDAAVKVIVGWSRNDKESIIDESLLTLCSKTNSYVSTLKELADRFNDDGTEKPRSTGYTGRFALTTFRKRSLGWVSRIWHRDKSPESMKIIDYETKPYVTPDESLRDARRWAHTAGIQKRLPFVLRLNFESERFFEKDCEWVSTARGVALNRIQNLVCAGNKTAMTMEQFDELVHECLKSLDRLKFAKRILAFYWDGSGNWIGPKDPVRSEVEATTSV